MWIAFLWNNQTGEILYDNSGLDIKGIERGNKKLNSLLLSYASIEKDNIKGIFGVTKSYIDELVKLEMADIIGNRKF